MKSTYIVRAECFIVLLPKLRRVSQSIRSIEKSYAVTLTVGSYKLSKNGKSFKSRRTESYIVTVVLSEEFLQSFS